VTDHYPAAAAELRNASAVYARSVRSRRGIPAARRRLDKAFDTYIRAAEQRGYMKRAGQARTRRARLAGQARVAQPRRPGGPSTYTLPAMQRSVRHPFDAGDYVTRRGHHIHRGDEVVVMTSNNVLSTGVVTELLPRAIGDVADVRVRNPQTGRTLIVNAVNVEPESGRVRGQGRTKSSVASRWREVHAAAAAGHPIRHPRDYVFGK
jgi:hypothetical protein